MNFQTTIVFGVIWAYTCYKMAQNRKRDPLLGALLGFLFGIFAIIGYAIAGKKKGLDK